MLLPMHVLAIALLSAQVPSAPPRSMLPGIREAIRRDGRAEITVSFNMPPVDLDGLTAKATLILDVAIGSCSSYLTKDESAIFSDCTVAVQKVLKGPNDLTSVVVRRNTGELMIDGAPVVVYERDFPAFQQGERYVLFLESYQGTYVVCYSADGAFRVTDGKVRQVLDGKWNDEHGEMAVDDFLALVGSTIKGAPR